jgi:predicted peptidase
MKSTLAVLLSGLPLLCALSLTAAAQPTSMATNQIAKTFSFSNTNEVKIQYLLYLPKGYDQKADKKWPMIFFLHGAGERGTNVWKVTAHGPAKAAAELADFPFIVVSPQCPAGQRWANESLLALLEDCLAKYKVDTKRVYLTGLSMGGYGTWNLGLSYPERFAAMAPICGGGEIIALLLGRMDRYPALKSMGIWAFHGAKDPVVPLEESERMVNALKKGGFDQVKFTVYPEAQHDSWTETYKNPELYNWFLQHERK